MNKDNIIATILLGLTLFVTYPTFAQAHQDSTDQCNANNPKNCPIPTEICNNGNHTNNPHCVTPTQIPTPTDCQPSNSPSPTQAPLLTPTDAPSVTVTQTPTPTPTDTPFVLATPTPGPTPIVQIESAAVPPVSTPSSAPMTGRAE